MRVDRAPYRAVAGQLPDSVAVDMVAAFDASCVYADKVGRVLAVLMSHLGIGATDPLMLAGQRLAAHIDAGGAGGHYHAYHHRRHLCEVMLTANFLAQLQKMSALECAEVVLAALVHDYGHDGKPNGREPFRLERQSVWLAEPMLEAAGLSDAQIKRIAGLVLATDIANGHRVAIAAHVSHCTRDTSAPGAGAVAADGHVRGEAPELAVLRCEPRAALQALVLCEADVLPSVGLTVEHAVKLQQDLAAEWGAPLDARDKLRFIDEWSRRCVVSTFFGPNVERLRAALLKSVALGDPRRETHDA
jgi:hypothetical protein